MPVSYFGDDVPFLVGNGEPTIAPDGRIPLRPQQQEPADLRVVSEQALVRLHERHVREQCVRVGTVRRTRVRGEEDALGLSGRSPDAPPEDGGRHEYREGAAQRHGKLLT